MQDRPTVDELLAAVQHFLEHEIVPAVEGRRQFHARVAANVIGIVRRELSRAPADTANEWLRLSRLLGKGTDSPPTDPAICAQQVRVWTEELCNFIREAPIDRLLADKQLWAHLEATVVEKLAVANPRWLTGAGESSR